MDAVMRLMRQTHHDPMNTSMFDAEAYHIHAIFKLSYGNRALGQTWGVKRHCFFLSFEERNTKVNRRLCHEYCLLTVHFMTLPMYALLIRSVLFH
jgi:hypothetical protein